MTEQYENNTQVQEFNKTFDGIDRMQTHRFISSPLFSKYSHAYDYLFIHECLEVCGDALYSYSNPTKANVT